MIVAVDNAIQAIPRIDWEGFVLFHVVIRGILGGLVSIMLGAGWWSIAHHDGDHFVVDWRFPLLWGAWWWVPWLPSLWKRLVKWARTEERAEEVLRGVRAKA